MELTTTYPKDNYTITVSHGAISLLACTSYDRVIVIADRTVLALHEERLNPLVSQAVVFPVTAGEKLKTLSSYQDMINRVIEAGVTRKSVIVAVGGGSIGDFAGFIAATVLRGIDFIQVPTTILAHDSAIGGKVGLNADGGKNLIGAFKRPAAVIYDLDFLTTLPDEEVLSGFGEVIKHAMLTGDDALRELMADFPDKQHLMALGSIEKWLMRGMQLKLDVVLQDEYESGQRRILNLGHTFGHAAEFLHGIPHGHAVMHGLLYASLLSGRETRELSAWFRALGLPPLDLKRFEDYLSLMAKDKKNSGAQVQFVLLLPEATVRPVPTAVLEETFRQLGGQDES